MTPFAGSLGTDRWPPWPVRQSNGASGAELGAMVQTRAVVHTVISPHLTNRISSDLPFRVTSSIRSLKSETSPPFTSPQKPSLASQSSPSFTSCSSALQQAPCASFAILSFVRYFLCKQSRCPARRVPIYGSICLPVSWLSHSTRPWTR